MQDCNICLNSCKIPVQLTHFQCYDPVKINCNSFVRFCLECYVKNKDILLKNCLICKSTNTTRSSPVVDLSYIYHDNFSRYTCDLCDNNKNNYYNHLDLYNHVLKNHIYSCEQCNDFILRNTFDKHQCKQKKKKPLFHCIECHQRVGEDDILKHYLYHLNETSSQIKLLEERTRLSKKIYKRLLKESEKIYKVLFPETSSSPNGSNAI